MAFVVDDAASYMHPADGDEGRVPAADRKMRLAICEDMVIYENMGPQYRSSSNGIPFQ